MRLSKRVAPISVSLAIIAAVTAVLFYFKDDDPRTDQHLVFFYLLPTAFVAILYGSVVSMLCAIAATFAAAFFLYDPTFSFYVSNPRDVGELIFFAGTALIGAKCTADITHPLEKPGNATAKPLQPL
jgi:K+-sensing histidine kinase KdpD